MDFLTTLYVHVLLCAPVAERPEGVPNFRDLTGIEVHAIGVYEPASRSIANREVRDWKKLIQMLLKPSTPAKRVWELLDKSAQDACKDGDVDKAAFNARTSELQGRVLSGLRRVIESPDFYSEDVFREARLSNELVDLVKLAKKRTLIQTLRLNRGLLSVALPEVFDDLPASYHGTTVKVDGGKKIILVLSSYVACRWSIEIGKGSEVAGVILGGYHTQEVEGVKSPVIYRAHDGPDGKWTKFQSVNAYSETHESYKAFMNLIKDLTGKAPVSFQGSYSAPKDGFSIPAKK